LLNLAVVAGVLSFLIRQQQNVRLTRSEAPVSASTTNAESTAISLSPEVVVTNQFQWAQLESEDYHEYIARLRSVGCPEPTIRDIIVADLDKLMAPEIQALYNRRKELRYWNSVEEELANDVDPRQVSRGTAEIEKRKREIVRELIGADLTRERLLQQGEEDYFERRLSFLPEDRRTLIREVLEKYSQTEQRFREKELEDGEPLNAGDRAEIRLLAQQKENELSTLLNPEEKAQFELWMSPSANSVRHAMYGMDATEQEFLVAYQARRAFDEKWADRDELFLDAAGRAELERDRQLMEAQIQEKLGPERFALYQRGQDEDFHSLSALATHFKLSREKVAEVYGYKKVAHEIKAQVRSNAELTEDQRKAALKAIAEETSGAVRASLGDRAYRYYLRTGQAGWIQE
jgi:hypothetical protein